MIQCFINYGQGDGQVTGGNVGGGRAGAMAALLSNIKEGGSYMCICS